MNKLPQLFSAFVVTFGCLVSVPILAGKADVVDVDVHYNGNNSFRVTTTLVHADTGWEHYANGWEILDESGKVIGIRVLHHPHVNEQPFSRSHTLDIPATVNTITVRGIDSVHGVGGETKSIKLVRMR